MKVNQKVRWESTYTKGRWFKGRVMLVVGDRAIVTDERDQYRQVVDILRLLPL